MILRSKSRFVLFVSSIIFLSLLFFPQKQLQARRVGYLSEAEVAVQVAHHQELFEADAGAIPLELAAKGANTNLIISEWLSYDRIQFSSLSTEAKNLLFLPYYVDNLFQGIGQETDRHAIGLVYSLAYLRQFSNEKAADILREIGGVPESSALVKLLGENFDYKGSSDLLSEQLKAIGEFLGQVFTDKKVQEIAEIIRTRDRIVNTSRALRIGFEALNYQGNNVGNDILEAIANTPEIMQVVSGLRSAAIINNFSGDITELEEVLWAMRQVQGEIINVIELPNNQIYVYNEYKVRQVAMKEALQDRLDYMVAVTRTGLEHLIKKDIIGNKNGTFFNLARLESEDKKLGLVGAIAPAIFVADRGNERYTYFDTLEQIYRASGLAGQVIELEKQVPDTVYIATLDRVKALKHQLQAELENYRIFNHYAPIVVIDNTKNNPDKEEWNLNKNKDNIDELRRRYGAEIIHVADSADVEDTSVLVKEYAAKLREKYQELLDGGNLDSRVKEILDGKEGVIVNGIIDEEKLTDYLRKNMFEHIFGVRNHMLLLAAIRDDKIIMNMDDDAPAETYISLNRERYNQERQESFDKVIANLIKEANGKGINVSTIDELYQQWNNGNPIFKELENKYFAFVAEDEAQGLLPQAMEEIKKLQDQYLAAAKERGIEITHMRYQSLMEPLAALMVCISDFVYEPGRKDKNTGGFMILPVNIFSQYGLINQTVRDTGLMVFKDDLRGTMAVPETKEELEALLDNKILYVAYPFIGDQDTSALAQLVAYLSGDDLSSVELQHTHRSAFLNEGVAGFAGDTYIIFNRGMFSTEVIFPSIGRHLRLEEPPYVKWIINPVMNDGVISAFAKVGGGQLRIIGERAYVIAGQDFTEVVGGAARSFYEAAVENFRQNNPSGDFMERLRELGRAFINITSDLTLSEEQRDSLLDQREIRARLMAELGIRRGEKEKRLEELKKKAGIMPSEDEAKEIEKREQEIRDIDGALVEWANSFYLSRYDRVETAPKSEIYISTPNSDKDYFYKIWSDGKFLHWQKVASELTVENKNGVNVVTNSKWTVLGGGVKELSFWEKGQPFEIEQGRWIVINSDISQLPGEEYKAIVPALVKGYEEEYIDKIIDEIVKSIRSDGETMVLWPDVLKIAEDMKEDSLFAKLFGM